MEDWSVCLKKCCRKIRGGEGRNERLRSRGWKKKEEK